MKFSTIKKVVLVTLLAFTLGNAMITRSFAATPTYQLPDTTTADDVSQKKTDGYTVDTQVTPINKSYLGDTLIKDLWHQGYYGKNINIAVIDSGVESNHKDLNIYKTLDCFTDLDKGCIETEGDTDSFYHGTHVAGIINAQHNDIGIDGVAPLANLYTMRISEKRDDKLYFNAKSYENAVDWAIKNNIDIINLSLSFKKNDSITTKINEAVKKGIIVVVAAGNGGASEKEEDRKVGYPATLDSVISVSNMESPYSRYLTSSFGPEVFIGAPGVGINSTIPLDKDNKNYIRDVFDDEKDKEKSVTYKWDEDNPEGYQQLNGTSMASPVVAGTLALLKQKYPNASGEKLKEYLRVMAAYPTGNVVEGTNERIDPTTNQIRNNDVGYGFLQAEVGIPTEQTITLTQTTKIYDLPYDKYYTGATLNPQTVKAVRRGLKGTNLEGWFEISTWLGYRWIKPSQYQEEVNYKLTFATNVTLYSDTNKTQSYGGLQPQTVTATKRAGKWFLINTYLGPKWISPTDYTIGDFQLVTHYIEILYDKPNGSSLGGTISGQEVNVLARSNDWFQIQSYLGKVWIRPFSYEPKYLVTPNRPYLERTQGTTLDIGRNYEDSLWVNKGNGDSFTALLGINYSTYTMTDYYIGEYNLKLLQDFTFLFDEQRKQTPEILRPQTVKVLRRVVEGQYVWFHIKTPYGNRWCKLEKGDYLEYQ